MALSLRQKKEIGTVRLHWSFMLNKVGRPIGVFPNGRFPRHEELFGIVKEKIEESGFSLKRVSPIEANCVIRLYSNLCVEFDEEAYCFLGASFYTKAHGKNKWVKYNEEGEGCEIDFSKCEVEVRTSSGEERTVEADYFDVFVKVFKQ